MTRDHRRGHSSTNDVTMTSSDDNNNDTMATQHTWDITDNLFPIIEDHDEFVEYPMGYVKYAYSGSCIEARTHQSGWAARNANNHNQDILKKSCLGVLLCDRQCQVDNGKDIVRVRPSICDKARKKQINKPCPTEGCDGRLRLKPCRGHGGYPVTHFWREVCDPCPGMNASTIFFQAKGEHDHPPPHRKSAPAPTRVKARLKENRKPLSKVRRQRLAAARPAVLSLAARYHDNADKQPLASSTDGILPADWKLSPEHQVALYNNSCHVTSLTNHISPYDCPPLLSNDLSERSGSASQTFPTNYIVDEFFSSPWNGPATASNFSRSQQPTESFQPTKYLPPPRQLPVSFDDVISARQLDEYYGNAGGVYPPTNHIAWYDSPRELCQYEKNSISGSSFGTYQMTRNAATSLTVYPTSSSSWLSRQQEPINKACAEYRMSRHHVVTDVTSARCGWSGGWDFDEMMWQGKFVAPLQGL